MKLKIFKLLAKKISYGEKRKRKNVKFIVIHGTGNVGDTAKNNAIYFNKNNTRKAGAHFFVGKNGGVYKSVNMNRTAYAVGGDFRNSNTNGGKFYGECTNSNSVSIELCDSIQGVSKVQIETTKKLIQYIQTYCPNAKYILRHWDVNAKMCPIGMCGIGNSKWIELRKRVLQ